MHLIKFREEYTHQGSVYYEPANSAAFEVLEFLRPNNQAEIINESSADRIFPWLEALGHEVKIIQGRSYGAAQ